MDIIKYIRYYTKIYENLRIIIKNVNRKLYKYIYIYIYICIYITSCVAYLANASGTKVVGRGTHVVGTIPFRTIKIGITIICRGDILYNCINK